MDNGKELHDLEVSKETACLSHNKKLHRVRKSFTANSNIPNEQGSHTPPISNGIGLVVVVAVVEEEEEL